MPFPKVERSVYPNNPLEEVICQLRFPTILKIDSQSPVEFQESIRKEYPNLVENNAQEVQLNVPQHQAIQAIEEFLRKSSKQKSYDFISRDGYWKVGLTNNFLALSSKNYRHWDEFKEKLLIPFTALKNVYEPTFFTRIGLRYRNLIRRSEYSLNDVSWSELLNPVIGGVFGEDKIGANVTGFVQRLEVNLYENRGIARIASGLAASENNDEIAFLIDNDLFNEDDTEVDDAIQQLDYFHERAERIFRWLISDRLHQTYRGSKTV